MMVLSFDDGRRIMGGDMTAERLARRYQCPVDEAQKALLTAGILHGHQIHKQLSTEIVEQVCG